jgi:LuxR family transcriptional regulator, maltose regulon positive regulatory protein
MADLLQVAAKRGTVPEYARQLLTAFGNRHASRTPVTQLFVEPLSARELDVVRLLGTDLDGPDVARQLLVSVSTLRTHTRSIYSKLGVNNRRAAVRRAEELLRQ